MLACFLDYSLFLWPFVGVCTFKEVGITYSLYRLASAGKALHQAAHPGILSEMSCGVY